MRSGRPSSGRPLFFCARLGGRPRLTLLFAANGFAGVEDVAFQPRARLREIPALERAQNLAVLSGRLAQTLGTAGPPRIPFDVELDALDRLHNGWRFRPAIESAMKLPVLQHPARAIVLDLIGLVANLAQLVDVGLVEAFLGLAQQMRFENGAHLDRFENLRQRHASHDGAVVRDVPDQAFGLELTQGLANWAARDAEELRQLDLVQLFVVGELSVIDRRAQRRGQIVGDGLAVAQDRVPFHPLEFLRADPIAERSAIASSHSSPAAVLCNGKAERYCPPIQPLTQYAVYRERRDRAKIWIPAGKRSCAASARRRTRSLQASPGDGFVEKNQ